MAVNFLKYPLFAKHRKILFILFPFLPISIAFLNYYHTPVHIIEIKDQKESIGHVVYNDHLNGGKSIAEEVPDSNGITFKYTLKDGLPYPYSGIALYGNQESHLDLSPYDYLKIRIRASNGSRLPIIVNTHIENYTRPEDFNTLRNNQVILNVGKEFREIQLDMDDLETPEWWYTQNKISENRLLGEPDYSKVKTINISNCIALGNNKEDFVEIQEISFHVDLFPFSIYSFLFMLIFYSTGAFFLRKKRKASSEINFLYEKTETINHLENNEEKVFQFLTTHYHRDDLSIVEVQNATGINEQKISSLIQKKTGKNFKQFLNKLRVAEAKRLLKETDLQVSEIAFKVGYANVSHFNRVFKDLENCSPKDFKKQELGLTSK